MFELNHGAVHLTLVPVVDQREAVARNTLVVSLCSTVAYGLGYRESSIGCRSLQVSVEYQVIRIAEVW